MNKDFQKTKEEKTHALKLNHHLIHKLKSLLKQKQNVESENTKLKEKVTKAGKNQSAIQSLENKLKNIKKIHLQEIHQLNNTKEEGSKKYLQAIQWLKKDLADNQKRYRSEINKLNKQIQTKKLSQQQAQNRIKQIKKLNIKLSHYLDEISKKGEYFNQMSNKHLLHKEEQKWKEKQQKLLIDYTNKLARLKKQNEQGIKKLEEKHEKQKQEMQSNAKKQE